MWGGRDSFNWSLKLELNLIFLAGKDRRPTLSQIRSLSCKLKALRVWLYERRRDSEREPDSQGVSLGGPYAHLST